MRTTLGSRMTYGVEGLNYVAFAIPVLLGSVLLEARVGRKRGLQIYNFGTAMSDLTTGTVFQALELLLKLAAFGAYIWVFEHWRLAGWERAPWVPWVIGFVGIDLLFYWWHRSSHVVNTLWAVHGVHHQSEDYNLAVALRQPAFEPITWFLFYIPLALLGVSPGIYLAAYALNRGYQFFIHTQLVDRLSPALEWVLNTPSHHRVHHGVQDQYLDKNYGAILIVWDRLFGTFEVEDETVVYGTTVPLDSYNPVWGNLQYFVHMAALARQADRVRDKLWVWFAHPAWLPEGVSRDPNEKKRLASPKYVREVSPALTAYVIGHYAMLGIATVPLLLLEQQFSILQLSIAAGLIILSCAVLLGLIEDKAWARNFEPVRGPLLAVGIAYLASTWWSPVVVAVLGALILGASLAALAAYRRTSAPVGA